MPTKWNIQRDGYIKLEVIDGDGRKYLRMTPSPQCLSDLKDRWRQDQTLEARQQGQDSLSGDQLLWDSLEDHLTNGWERVEPHEIGALTDAPIISNNLQRDDHGRIIDGTHVYAYMSYQVRSVMRDLLDYGFASWQYSPLEFKPEVKARKIVADFMEHHAKVHYLARQNPEQEADELLAALKKAGLQIVQQTNPDVTFSTSTTGATKFDGAGVSSV